VGRRPDPPSRSPVSRGDSEDFEDTPATPSLADLLATIAERSSPRRSAAEEVESHSPRERPRAGFPVVGCLFRLVLFIIILFLLVVGGLFFLLNGGNW
jgi:hypothetical protein